METVIRKFQIYVGNANFPDTLHNSLNSIKTINDGFEPGYNHFKQKSGFS